MNPCSGYLWKWADNDLPGRPNDVFAKLVRGEMHPALQPFDPMPVVQVLEKCSDDGLADHEEWSWRICPHGKGQRARFIYLQCLLKDNPTHSPEPVLDQLQALDMSGYDDECHRLIPNLSPKLNMFLSEQWDERSYDIDGDELAVLLRRLSPSGSNPFAILTDRCGNFVQCMGHGCRYNVEWHEQTDPKDWNQLRSWRLESVPVPKKRRYFIPAGVEYSRVKDRDWHPCFTGDSDHETISFSETLSIFRCFLHGKPRPRQYRWRNITTEIA
jgi:hypothetical protein